MQGRLTPRHIPEELYIYRKAMECERLLIERDKEMTDRWWQKRWKSVVILDLEQLWGKIGHRAGNLGDVGEAPTLAAIHGVGDGKQESG